MPRGVADTVKLHDCVCVCVCVCLSVPAVSAHGCNATKTNSFYRLPATFSWILICGFVLELWLLLLAVKALAVSSEFRVVDLSSVRTTLRSTYELALHQSACYLLATRVQQKSIVNSSMPECMHTQSRV